MSQSPKVKRWLVAGLVFVASAVIFLSSDPRTQLSWPEKIVRDTLAPVQDVLAGVGRSMSRTTESIVAWRELVHENARLKTDVERLTREVVALQEAGRENQRLRDALGLVQTSTVKQIAVEIIARPLDNWANFVTVNKGSRAGIKPGMPVVTAHGVVGHVQNVTAGTAQVLLIIDRRSAIGAIVRRTSQLMLVEGARPTAEALHLKPLVREANVEVGDEIITSGLSQIFPKGLPIGTVVSVKSDEYGFVESATVRPYVDFSRIEFAFALAAAVDAEGEGDTSASE